MTDNKIKSHLILLGVDPSILGFGYLTEAIKRYDDNLKVMALYRDVAKAKGAVNEHRVERNIRTAVGKSHREGMTNKRFISQAKLELEAAECQDKQ